jgi:hypothetical protein
VILTEEAEGRDLMRAIISVMPTCWVTLTLCGCAASPSSSTIRSNINANSDTTVATPPSEVAISPQSAVYSNTVILASGLASQAKFGNPAQVEWQPEPFNRYIVIYPTPERELGYAGDRAIFVTTNGEVSYVPRE